MTDDRVKLQSNDFGFLFLGCMLSSALLISLRYFCYKRRSLRDKFCLPDAGNEEPDVVIESANNDEEPRFYHSMKKKTSLDHPTINSVHIVPDPIKRKKQKASSPSPSSCSYTAKSTELLPLQLLQQHRKKSRTSTPPPCYSDLTYGGGGELSVELSPRSSSEERDLLLNPNLSAIAALRRTASSTR